MKYLALLRGINVGGKNTVSMARLKTALEEVGFRNVLTYINSGNVIFESGEKNIEKVTKYFEDEMLTTFKLGLRVVIITDNHLNQVLKNVPKEWKKENNLRRYIAFVRKPVMAKEVVEVTKPREGVDSVKVGDGVFYLTTKMEGLTKSGFTS